MASKDTGIVNIHGKEYKTVAKRVEEFRANVGTWYEDAGIETELVDRDETTVVMKATITNKEGRVIATGYAEESRASSMINKTSALENCETSAIGRALACLGLAGTEFASADELANAIKQQKAGIATAPPSAQLTKLKREILDKLKEKGKSKEFVYKVLKKETVDSEADALNVLEALDEISN